MLNGTFVYVSKWLPGLATEVLVILLGTGTFDSEMSRWKDQHDAPLKRTHAL